MFIPTLGAMHCLHREDFYIFWSQKFITTKVLSDPIATYSVVLFNTLESLDDDCGVGLDEAKIFSGATVVCDFCAHPHKDTDNVEGGCTVILTLTKPDNRGLNSQPEDEQLHGNKKHTIFLSMMSSNFCFWQHFQKEKKHKITS